MHFWQKNKLNVKILIKSLLPRSCFLSLALLSLALLSLSVQAVNISEYRIYLDEDNRDVSFVIFNRQGTYQDCKLRLTHNDFDADSIMHHLAEDIVPDNSAKDWIRFSPREFFLTPAQSQTVRFSMRRKANAQDGEYRSYLLIDCETAPGKEEEGKPKPQVNLQTKLIHSVPIIVRSGKLEANVWIDNISLQEDVLSLTVNRSGNRSVYGDVELLHKATGELVSMQRNFSIYPESARFHITLGMKNYELKDLILRFIENPKYGGTINLEIDPVTFK
jgi:P pilus assembly chaperone PapD